MQVHILERDLVSLVILVVDETVRIHEGHSQFKGAGIQGRVLGGHVAVRQGTSIRPGKS